MRSIAMFSWSELISASKGEAVSHYRSFEKAFLETDTRTIDKESFFIPLSGENFDGNNFIEKAYEKGAQGAFISSDFLKNRPDLKRFPNLIEVENTLIAYLTLASFHKERSNVKVIAITGSSGKTTTKDMLYTMLSSILGKEVQKSEKNFNNEIGVALTLLNIQSEARIVIQEMGMRGLGQIELLSRFVKPDIAVITNIGPAHIGLLGSIEAIAQAKCEIFSGMDSSTGVGIINEDSSILVNKAGEYWNGCIETFSLHEVEEIHTFPDGHISFNYEGVTFTLAIPGKYNVMNALACIKTCEWLGIPLVKISDSLVNFKTEEGRWEKTLIEGFNNLWVINDAYNANPTSMKAGLSAFMEGDFEGLKKVAIIGGMAELGNFSEDYHRQLGEWLNTQQGLNELIVVGKDAYPMAKAVQPDQFPVYWFETNAEAVLHIQRYWLRDAIIFLKASRSCHLEEIPELLKIQNSHVI